MVPILDGNWKLVYKSDLRLDTRPKQIPLTHQITEVPPHVRTYF